MSLCRLCGTVAELQLSHIIPAFIFRWKRETSGGGYLRTGEAPNKRVQDGEKRYWLCKTCEDRFGRSETLFSAKLFYPYAADGSVRVRYGSWMLSFAASLIWRAYTLTAEANRLAHLPEDEIVRLRAATQAWSEFLLGKRRHPGQFQIHVLPLDGIEGTSRPTDMPVNINRYLLRGVEIDIPAGKSCAFVYVKLPRFAFMGFSRLDKPQEWGGTKIHAMEGTIEPRKYTVPKALFDYFQDRARRQAKLLDSVSERQQKVIDDTFRANVDKLVGSDLVRAMEHDVRMFGDEAFRKKGD
jgi:hypothetical protein